MYFINSRRSSYEELGPISEGYFSSGRYIAWSLFIGSAVLSIFLISLLLSFHPFRHRGTDLFKNSFQLKESLDSEILVSVKEGQIRGKTLISRDGRSYFTFHGVPYAKPPIKTLRFMPPEPPEPWEGVIDGTDFKPQCIQLYKDDVTGSISVTGSEDCLYLTIYTPKKFQDMSTQDKLLPVIFYIHGGINNGNASQYSAEYIMDEDVVLVMVHYRLHVFGNLNTGDSESRGNFGIKDQVMALKWVQNNIVMFGGDREKVTLYGNSYGSMCVSVHLLSPMSKGLFHQAIMQSGTIFRLKKLVDGREEAMKLGEALNCPRKTSKELVECLRKKEAGTLTKTVIDLNFMVTVEPKSTTPDKDTCLPDEPLKLIQERKLNAVPTIHGVTSGEELVPSLELVLRWSESNYVPSDELKNIFFTGLLGLENVSNSNTMVESVRNFYLGNQWSLTRDYLVKNLTNMLSDRSWIHPMTTFAKYQFLAKEQQRGKPIFLYYFSKESNESFAKRKIQEYEGTNPITDFQKVTLKFKTPYTGF